MTIDNQITKEPCVEDLANALVDAFKKLPKTWNPSPEVLKEMARNQYLALASEISNTTMSGGVTPEILAQERRENEYHKKGMQDQLMGKRPQLMNFEYRTGYRHARDECPEDSILRDPEVQNILGWQN